MCFVWFINVYHGSSLIFVGDIPLWHGLDPRKKSTGVFPMVFRCSSQVHVLHLGFGCNAVAELKPRGWLDLLGCQ